jgi:hypothetical protein
MHEGEWCQQVTDRRCIVRSRWECGVDFDDVSGLDHLKAVGRGLLVWVESGS